MSFEAYFLIGSPLSHTLSPFIHRRLFALSGHPALYEARELPPEHLRSDFLTLCKTACGFNVTIPYKQSILPLLTRAEGCAARYRAVNTVAVTAEGTIGYNTDAEGFLRGLASAGMTLSGRVALLGCGGAGRTFACEAALAGCEIVNVVRRQHAQAKELEQFVRALVPHVRYTCVMPEDMTGSFDLLINATPVGMFPQVQACPVPPAALTRAAAVFDAIYNPRQTRLLALAAAAGANTAGGLGMLVWQAAAAHRIWYGATFQEQALTALITEAAEQ